MSTNPSERDSQKLQIRNKQLWKNNYLEGSHSASASTLGPDTPKTERNQQKINRERERESRGFSLTVKGEGAVVLAPADAAGGVEVLLDEVAAVLVVVDALDAVAPLEPLPEDLGRLDLDPLLPHYVLPHLQHRHGILVRILRVEVVRRALVEHHSLLPPHLAFVFLFFLSLSAFSLCGIQVDDAAGQGCDSAERVTPGVKGRVGVSISPHHVVMVF